MPADEVLHPNAAVAVIGGTHAIALALQESVDPLETLRYVSQLGDDADTVGTMAGGLPETEQEFLANEAAITQREKEYQASLKEYLLQEDERPTEDSAE
jgi:ADP-ribosylglycohydrolase